MAGVRLTGLNSGLDTESLVQQLSKAYQTKVDNIKKEKTKVEWKKEAWASLNTKIMDFYKGALSTFKSVSSYRTKAVTGDLSGVKITAGNNAVNGSHRVKVLSTATAQMWTGKRIDKKADGTDVTYTATSYRAAIDSATKLSDLKDDNGDNLAEQIKNMKFTVSADGKADFTVDVSGMGLGDQATLKDVIDGINQRLSDNGYGDMSVDFAGGNFRITNSSTVRTATTTQNEDGEDVTTMEVTDPGYGIKITAADDTTAAFLGVKPGEGTTVQPASAAENDIDVPNVIGGSKRINVEVKTDDTKVTGSTKITDLGVAAGTEIKLNGTAITIGNNTTLDDLAKQMSKLGIDASYDAGQGRFYLNAKNTGKDNGFTIEADDPGTLAVLGLDLKAGDEGRIDASDAIIEYNGVKYENSTNTFSINGLTIEAVEAADAGEKSQTFSVGTDAQGIYDKIKEFVKSYNDLIKEMNQYYHAPRVKDYEPLTDEEKAAMSDKEVENWEKVIKESILRRDSTISSLLSSMRTTLCKQISVTGADGTVKNYSLASFGINTGVYTEYGALHIYGNKDDTDYADYEDKLLKAIMENPDAVEKTLSGLGTEIYNNLQKAMRRVDGLSSAMTFYNDVTIDKEIDDYKDKVSNMQDKMSKEEDKYYAQFAAMETALAKLQSQQTYISQLFGM